jgi:hypothetical protein
MTTSRFPSAGVLSSGHPLAPGWLCLPGVLLSILSFRSITMETRENSFRRLSQIDVARYVEKKGQFNYLSWPFAVAQLRLADPAATWEVRRFEGLPYLITEAGVFVEVAVTVEGITLSQIHPVLDGKNRPLMAPSSFDINTSLQRCLVKAIALHGLGLSIYAGEDLPDFEAANDAVADLPPPAAKPQLVPAPQGKPAKPGASAEPLTAAQLRLIRRLMTETGVATDQLLGYFGFDALENIPKTEVNRVIRALENSRGKEVA